jgi:hypothetical protein
MYIYIYNTKIEIIKNNVCIPTVYTDINKYDFDFMKM